MYKYNLGLTHYDFLNPDATLWYAIDDVFLKHFKRIPLFFFNNTGRDVVWFS